MAAAGATPRPAHPGRVDVAQLEGHLEQRLAARAARGGRDDVDLLSFPMRARTPRSGGRERPSADCVDAGQTARPRQAARAA